MLQDVRCAAGIGVSWSTSTAVPLWPVVQRLDPPRQTHFAGDGPKPDAASGIQGERLRRRAVGLLGCWAMVDAVWKNLWNDLSKPQSVRRSGNFSDVWWLSMICNICVIRVSVYMWSALSRAWVSNRWMQFILSGTNTVISELWLLHYFFSKGSRWWGC